MNRKLTSFIAMPALAALVGCSSDVTFSSTIDGDKQLSEITPEEAATICTELQNVAVDLALATQEGACKLSSAVIASLTGGGGAGVAVVCETAYNECMSQAVPAPDPDDCSNAEAPPGTCSATVGEFEACYNDTSAQRQAAFQDFASQSCADLLTAGSDPLASFQEQDETPASCQVLIEKCPEFTGNLPGGTSTSTTTTSTTG